MLIKPNFTNSKHVEEGLSEELLSAFKTIVEHLTSDPKMSEEEKQNFRDTPVRALKGYMEICRPYSDILKDLEAQLRTGFPVNGKDDARGMVTLGPIKAYSLCPHHLFQIEYNVYVSYIPKSNCVLGLSKIPRIVKLLAQRPVLQEQFTKDVADVLFHSEDHDMPSIETHGSAVQTIGKHGCVACRGVKDDSSVTSVTELRGAYWEPSMEHKFYEALRVKK